MGSAATLALILESASDRAHNVARLLLTLGKIALVIAILLAVAAVVLGALDWLKRMFVDENPRLGCATLLASLGLVTLGYIAAVTPLIAIGCVVGGLLVVFFFLEIGQ